MKATDLLRTSFAAFFIAIVSAVFAISFAAILYSGELSSYLGQGIGLTLIGTIALAIIGSFTLSYRGTIVQVQDVPAILLAGAASTIIAQGNLPENSVFPTIVGLVIVTTLTTGFAACLLGRLRQAYIARYIPYPVLAGFLATTGILLFLGGIGVAVGSTPDIHNFQMFVAPELLKKWAPAVIAASLIVLSIRLIPGSLTLPVALILTAAAFFAYILVLGLSEEEARAQGFLLGPFQSGGFLTDLSPSMITHTNWTAVFSQLPTILTIVSISLVGTTLNASGLELEIGRDLDINTEMTGTGLGNLVSGMFAGLPGYHLLGETLLANRLGLTGRLAGLSAALGCLIVLFIGGDLLSLLPVGLFAAVIIFLGMDLMFTWLWEERKRLSMLDYSIVLLIPVIAITLGFLTAIAAGLLAAIAIFVLAYAKLDMIRSQTTLSARRSFVERPDDQLEVLSDLGQQAKIFELTGYLFFGSANILRERINDILAKERDTLRWIIIDFSHVSGMDISTRHVLQRVEGDCETYDVTVLFSAHKGLSGRDGQKTNQYDTLDRALEYVEEALLAKHSPDQTTNVITQLSDLFSVQEFDHYFKSVTVAPQEIVIRHLTQSKEMFFLQDGQLSVRIATSKGNTAVVAQIRAGSVFGEMAYYTGLPRSADIVADKPSQLFCIDSAQLDELEESKPRLAAEFHKLIARHMARRLTRTTKLLSDFSD